MLYSNYNYSLTSDDSGVFPFAGLFGKMAPLFPVHSGQCKLTIESGMNKNLNLCLCPDGKNNIDLLIRHYEEDWRNTEDPRWNIPNTLFLLLTSNFEKDSQICKYGNGKIFNPTQNVWIVFKTLATPKDTRFKGNWEIGIYKIKDPLEPVIFQMLPMGHRKPIKHGERWENPTKYLIAFNNQVYQENAQSILTKLDKLNIPREKIAI